MCNWAMLAELERIHVRHQEEEDHETLESCEDDVTKDYSSSGGSIPQDGIVTRYFKYSLQSKLYKHIPEQRFKTLYRVKESHDKQTHTVYLCKSHNSQFIKYSITHYQCLIMGC